MTDNRVFTVIRYTPEFRSDWEDFLTSSSNGTIFHSLRFFRYHLLDRFKHHHLIFRLRGKIRAVFTGADIAGAGGLELRSHPGASYGGFVIRNKADFEDYYGMVEALVEYAKSCGFKAIRLTQTPLIYHQRPHQGIEFALRSHGFEIERCELTQSVDLTALQGNVIDSLTDKTRNAFRQSVRKGLKYEEGVELSRVNLTDFHRILMENRESLGVTPTHTFDELVKLSEIIPEYLHLSFVSYESQRVGGLLHFICNARVALLFYVCHLREYQDLKPVPFILTKTVEWARSQGFRELDFGISTVDGVPNRGLLKFKENFTARPFLRNTYRITLE
ncbi:MAG: GNAT family N-acetyltransferase [candidate division Zixibacteria bacterium]|nr:GNAT family N-acetyltransferase [Candidatus Tariuqbacter arcticus]